MENLFEKLAECVEFGKINKAAPYPPNMKDMDGADEITQQLLDGGASADDILTNSLIIGMEKIGIKFRENKVFVPQVLMSAKAMSTSMAYLKPLFAQGDDQRKGTFIVGTVEGDLHDIGKNLVAMIVEGNGYEVIDLGTDVSAAKFVEAAEQHPGATIGLSALLTTTMANMEDIVKTIKEKDPDLKVCVGGAPVNEEFKDKINADVYSADPQGLVEFLNKMAS